MEKFTTIMSYLGLLKDFLFKKKKSIMIYAVILLIGVMFLKFQSDFNIRGNNNKLDLTNKNTASRDTLSGNAIKIGDVGSVKGDLILGNKK